MTAVGLVLVSLGAVFHFSVFVLESLRWTRPATRAVFGVATAEDAETTKPLAFNQGFYNLFLAVVTIVGVVLLPAGATEAGYALLAAGAGSMVGAGLVLLLSDPGLRRAALLQAGPPGLGLIALGIGALLS